MRVHKIFSVIILLSALFASECFADFQEIEFGRYYQNAGTKNLTPLEWLILDESGENFLLITKQCIEARAFNEQRKKITFEECTLNKWLNGEFFNTAFNAQEREAINQGKIFLLTSEQVIKYMPEDSQRQCTPTSYAQNNGVYVNPKGLCAWWTSSQSKNPLQAEYLNSSGAFGSRPHYVDDKVIGVRPAVFVKKSFLAEKFLYSVKLDPQKVYEVETKLQPILEQKEPFNVKELYDYFLQNPQKALAEFDRKRIKVKGIVLRKGPDIFGNPSIELSDAQGEKCYILCVFQDSKSYSAVNTGDEISIQGNYLALYEGYGIVLKISELI